jgi:hypothetical protein
MRANQGRSRVEARKLLLKHVKFLQLIRVINSNPESPDEKAGCSEKQ